MNNYSASQNDPDRNSLLVYLFQEILSWAKGPKVSTRVLALLGQYDNLGWSFKPAKDLLMTVGTLFCPGH